MIWEYIREAIRKHNKWILAFRPMVFIGVMLVYDLISRVIVSLLSFLVSLEPEKNSALDAGNLLRENGFETVFVETVLLAPMLETIACQWLPTWFTEKFTKNGYILVGISTIVFTLTHLFADIVMLTIVFLGGIIFAFSYVRWKAENIWLALGVTTIIHIVSNALAVGLALLE